MIRAPVFLLLALLAGCGGADDADPPAPVDPVDPVDPEPVPEEPDRPVEPEPPLDPEPPPPPPLTQQERWLARVNEFRSTERLCPGEGTVYAAAPAVAWNGALELAAISHSADMAANDFLSHAGSDGSHFSSRAFAAGYRGSPIFEVIAAGSGDFERTLNQWIESRFGHCGALMRPETSEIGAGTAFEVSSTYGHYWTLLGGVGGDSQ